MKIDIYDLEVFPTFFSYTGMDKDTLEIKQFYIHNNNNQLDDFIKYLKTLDGMIGFNNINYDYPILHYILNRYETWGIWTTDHILQFIYEESQRIINAEWTSIPYWNVKIPQLDLFKIWHFDNKARMTSLKAIEIAINFNNVQDLPFNFDHNVTEDEIEDILKYNLNDVNATYEFYKITKGDTELPLYKGKDKIQLRKDIGKKYGINCLNFNDVKIGDSINKLTYLKLSGKEKTDLKKGGTYRPKIKLKDCIPKYIKFNSSIMNKLLEDIKNTTITKTKGELEFDVIYNETKYTIKTGGLHSVDKPRHLISDENYKLIDADVSSYYPATILNLGLYPAHLGEEWLEGYREIFKTRLKAKKNGEMSVNEALKLSLNGGGFGKTNESYSWQYDPLIMTSVTIGGELSLLMLIERLEDNGIQVLSANTDGIISKVLRDKEELYYNICKSWEEYTNYGLEYTEYKQVVQTSVNDYLAETVDEYVKYKGDFEIDKELNKDPSMRIRAIALKEYFINSIPVDETIRNNTNIFDFCKRFKSSKGWKACKYSTNGTDLIKEDLQKNIRYYISNNGDKLTKENIKDGRKIDVEASVGITLFNKYIEKDIKDYNINYSYYISETNKIILSINDGQLKLF